MSQGGMAVRRYEAQPALFAPLPHRLDLQRLQPAGQPTRFITVNVWRNHAIEPVLALAKPYLDFGCIATTFKFSDYDDSLLFEGREDADVELLWLDSGHYLERLSVQAWGDWLAERMLALRAISPAPIILATWLDERGNGEERLRAITDLLPDCYLADIGEQGREAGMPVTDVRSAVFSGSRLNGRIHALLARKLACHWLSVAIPPIKAVVVDLDQTLYAGVLGEDGVAGIQLTSAHRELQEALSALRKRGIFLGLVSRNERGDAEELFACRKDFPLQWRDFSAMEISWQDKSAALVRIAEGLRIGMDSLLYVDDNLGELAAIGEALPAVPTIHASADATLTRIAITFYPGLWRWRTNADDERRVDDLAANRTRQELLETTSDSRDYFRSLAIEMTISRNPKGDVERLADLCSKTNQFNMALRRLTQTELAERMGREDGCVIAVRLRDRLADSGIVAVVVASRKQDRLQVEELCISCRALGRRLEDAMIFLALRGMPIADGCREVAFPVIHGPRNGPALEWLRLAVAARDCPADGEIRLPLEPIRDWVVPDGISYQME